MPADSLPAIAGFTPRASAGPGPVGAGIPSQPGAAAGDSRQDQEVFWVEPRDRAIIPIGGFRCSRSLARVIRQDRFTVTCDQAFEAVMRGCAEPRPDHPESWISDRIVASYARV